MKKIFVFGNEDLKEDSLSLRILPELKKRFPGIEFEIKDPNEEWEDTEEITLIDTIVGISVIEVFDDLEKFQSAPRVGMHDFDALSNLRYLQKLGKIRKVKIIGVPPDMDKEEVIKKITKILKT